MLLIHRTNKVNINLAKIIDIMTNATGMYVKYREFKDQMQLLKLKQNADSLRPFNFYFITLGDWETQNISFVWKKPWTQEELHY